MPRTRRTAGGDEAQPVGAIPGQNYGAGVEQMELQQAMPAPQAQQPTSPTGGQAQQPAPPPGQASIGDLLAIAKEVQAGGGLMNQPTSRPSEPITHGLMSGPGGGPDVLGVQPRSATGEWMRYLSQTNGDPYFEQLANRLGI